MSADNPYILMGRTLFYVLPSVALLLVLGKWGLEKTLGRDFRQDGPDFFCVASAFALGSASLGMFLGILGVAGIVHKWVGLSLWLAGFACLRPAFRWTVRAAAELFAVEGEDRASRAMARFFQAAACGWFFLFLWGCLTLTPDPDVLQNHWALASHYLNEGSVRPVPYNLFSYFPQTVEMLYLWQFQAGSEFSAKMLNFFAWAFLVFGLASFVKSRSSAWAGWFSAVLLAFLPAVTQGFYIPKNDSFLALYSAFALLFGLREHVWESGASSAFLPPASPEGRDRSLALAGLFTGAALATKYSAFPLLILLPVFIFIPLAVKRGLSLSFLGRSAAIFIFCALVFSTLWYGRNLSLTGNPAHPFGRALLRTDFSDETIRFGVRNLMEDGRRDWKDSFAEPKKISAVLFGLGPKGVALLFTPVLLALPFALRFLRDPGDGSLRCVGTASAVWIALGLPSAYFHYRSFIAPACLLLAILSVALGRASTSRAPLRFALAALLAASILNPRNAWAHRFARAGAMVLFQGMGPQTLRLSTGVESVLINDLAELRAFANANLPETSRILFAGETRAAGFRRRFVASSGYDLSVAEDWLERNLSVEAFAGKLKSEGITHVFAVPSGLRSDFLGLLSDYLDRFGRLIAKTHDGRALLFEVRE